MEYIPIFLQYLTQGGSAAVIVVLSAVIGVLLWDRKHLINSIDDTTQKVYDAKDSETVMLKEIVDKYHRGNVDLIQALNEIRLVLVTIQNTRS
jgi:hypothetical protein